MKYFLAIVGVGILCGGGYIRNEQPHVWNACLNFLKADEPPPVVAAAQPVALIPTPEASPVVAAPTPTPEPQATAANVALPATTPVPSSAVAPATNVVTAPSMPVAPHIFTPPHPLPTQANWTWTATDGKVYKNVIVTKVEADCVTVLDDEGGARVDIATLPPEIQKLLNYDPDLAKAAADNRAQAEANDKAALANEQKLVQQQLKASAATDQKPDPTPSTTLTDADKAAMQQKILDLQSDIRVKLRQVARDHYSDASDYQNGYRGGTSHTAYEDIIAKEAQEVAALQAKLGLPQSAFPVYYSYYPYYYYP